MAGLKQPPKGHEPKKKPASSFKHVFSKAMRLASGEAGLASVYHADGALLSAARAYRKTADYLDAAHRAREAGLADGH